MRSATWWPVDARAVRLDRDRTPEDHCPTVQDAVGVSEKLGSVEIGAREIYDAVMHLQVAVERLGDHYDSTHREVIDHETRIRTLERGRWPLPSLAVVVSAAAVIIAAVSLANPH